MRNDNLTSITFYLTKEELQQFKELAIDHDVSVSAVIRSLLKLPRLEPYKHTGTAQLGTAGRKTGNKKKK